MLILYIEDDPIDAQLVERFSKITKHQVIITNNTEDAKSALASSPDLILVDIILNNSRSGYRFVRDLRTQGFTQPIIALTALSLPQDIEACYEAGVTEILSKPYEITQLQKLFDKYMS